MFGRIGNFEAENNEFTNSVGDRTNVTAIAGHVTVRNGEEGCTNDEK
jgi:hypothetical protein